jgi:hypothetical protein
MRRRRRAGWDAARTRAERAWAASKTQRRTRGAGRSFAHRTRAGVSFCLPPSQTIRFRPGICRFARALFPSNPDVRVRRAMLQPPPPRSSRYNDRLPLTSPARWNPV